MMKGPLVYVAGPYTSPDPVHNTALATDAAELLIIYGFVPLVPHLNLLWDFRHHHPAEFWYDYDLALLARCDFLLRIPGLSPGADLEVHFAKENDIPVFYTLDELIESCEDGA